MYQRLKKDADILLAGLLAALVHASFFLYQGNFLSARQLPSRAPRHVLLNIIPAINPSNNSPVRTKKSRSIVKKETVHPRKVKLSHKKQVKQPVKKETGLPEPVVRSRDMQEQPEEKKVEKSFESLDSNQLASYSGPAVDKFKPTSPPLEGTGVNEVPVEAIVQKLHKPFYPRYSRIHGEEGRVVIRVTVSRDGKLESYKVIKSTGYPRLDKSAIKAIKKSRFAPALQGGRRVSSEKSIAFIFRLDDL